MGSLTLLFLSPPPSFLFLFFFSPSSAMFLVGPASTQPAPLPSTLLVLVRIRSSQWRFGSLRRFVASLLWPKGSFFSSLFVLSFLCVVLLLNEAFLLCLFGLSFFFLIFWGCLWWVDYKKMKLRYRLCFMPCLVWVDRKEVLKFELERKWKEGKFCALIFVHSLFSLSVFSLNLQNSCLVFNLFHVQIFENKVVIL